MAERISGLSIDLNMDTAGISRSLTDIKDSFRDLKRSAQVNMNNIKFSDKDLKSYKNNVDELSKSFNNQKKNVDDLKKEYDKMVATHGENSKEAQKVRIEYNKQADELNKLGHQLDFAKDKMHDLYVENSNFSKLGNTFQNLGGHMKTAGENMRQIGGTMTRYVTAPILGIIGAAGGMTAAFGWGRLVGLDTAQAQLKGLGYNTEEVGRISEQVTSAIDGGMTTMAEGTAVAAGALAAGVEEGAELEKYIKLVGDAAVGANRPVNEMATIFNRVQGTGQLMTGELNQVEDALPGFSQAMADHLGVSYESMREMVTAGEVTSEDFLTVMDGFAGEMAAAYSNSWQGMVANTKAYIGIIGENLLGGVFEQSKESIAEFIEFLKSDEVVEWAKSAGESIGNAFTRVVDALKSAITWFTSLSAEKQKLIGIAAAVAVALGPLLMIFGSLTIFIGQVVTVIGGLFAWLGTLSGGIKTVMSGLKPFAAVFPKLAGFISLLTGPIGITVAAITALGAGFVLAYNKSERFRNFIDGLREKFSNAITWIGQFKDGIAGLFKDDGTGGVDILTSIGISEEMANRLNDMVGKFFEFKWKVEEVIADVKTTIQGIFAIFQGDHTLANDLLRSVGMDEETINKIFLGVARVKQFFSDMKNGISQALSAVSVFAQDTFAKIRSFWQSDGEQTVQAVKNGFNLIRSIISAVMPVVTTIVRVGFNLISTVIGTALKVALSIVKMVWQNIKGVINGGLNIIMGLVKTFSGIFTGDFSKMWEGVKQVFSGAIQFVWNAFQLMFYGRIIKGVGSLVKLFSGSIRSLWANVVGFFRNMFTGAVSNVSNMISRVINFGRSLNTRFNSIIASLVTRVLGFFRNMLSNVVSIANNLRTRVVTTVGNLRMNFVNIIQNLLSRVRSIFNNILNTARNIFESMRNSVTNLITRMRDGVVNGVSRMRDRVATLFNRVKDKATETFNNMVDGAKKLPGRIGTGIKNMASKAVDGVKSLGNSMTEKLGSVVNGVIGGLNSITGKLGISATISEWTVPTFSTGTNNGRLTNDTLGIVNDRGPGNGRGGATQELIERDGSLFAPKGKNVLTPLKKGDRIFNGAETQSLMSSGIIPRFSQGTGAESGGKKEKKGVWSSLKDFASNVWDFIKEPKEAIKAIVSDIAPDFSGFTGFAGNMISGGFEFIKDKALDFITGIFKDNEGALGSGKKGKWMNYRMTTPYSPLMPVPGYPTSFNGGRHYGVDYGTPIGTPITAPTAGKVTSFWNEGGGKIAKLVTGQLRQFFMHMQTVNTGTVKQGDVLGKSGNSGKWTTGPHVHWQAQEGTDTLNKNTVDPLKVINGHKNGGHILSDGLFRLHKGEYVINPNEPSEAQKLIALAGKKLAGKSKQTRELPNPGGAGDNRAIEALLQIVDNQQRQIEQTNQMIKTLFGIEKKSGITPKQIADAYDSETYEQDSLSNLFRGRKGGPSIV